MGLNYLDGPCWQAFGAAFSDEFIVTILIFKFQIHNTIKFRTWRKCLDFAPKCLRITFKTFFITLWQRYRVIMPLMTAWVVYSTPQIAILTTLFGNYLNTVHFNLIFTQTIIYLQITHCTINIASTNSSSFIHNLFP